MRNIVDYARTEFRSFDEKPFGPVDSLILSQLSYIHFEGVVPGFEPGAVPVRLADCNRAECFETMFHFVRDAPNSLRLLQAAAASPRFRNIRATMYISDFDPENDKQFSALTFLLPGSTAYVAFRGTDDTIIGWKEDFMMAFVFPVPSQTQAAFYLSEAFPRLNGPILLGGHSKGGNLAVYAALTADEAIRRRITAIYDHDGPGFREGVLDCESYAQIEPLIQKTVPQSSIIGMLLEGHRKYTVVESSRIGVMQHDPFSWKLADDAFLTSEEVTDGAKYMDRTIREWVNNMDDAERERFTDILFGILDAGDAGSFAAMNRQWRKNYTAIFSAIVDADPDMKKFIRQIIRDFATLMVKNLKSQKSST